MIRRSSAASCLAAPDTHAAGPTTMRNANSSASAAASKIISNAREFIPGAFRAG